MEKHSGDTLIDFVGLEEAQKEVKNMEEPLKKEQLREMEWFQVLRLEDLQEAKRKETFNSFAMRNNYKKLDDAKIDYLIYKHELNM